MAKLVPETAKPASATLHFGSFWIGVLATMKAETRVDSVTDCWKASRNSLYRWKFEGWLGGRSGWHQGQGERGEGCRGCPQTVYRCISASPDPLFAATSLQRHASLQLHLLLRFVKALGSSIAGALRSCCAKLQPRIQAVRFPIGSEGQRDLDLRYFLTALYPRPRGSSPML